MKSTHLTGLSLDIVEENIEKLRALFPEIVTEGKNGNKSIDFDKLKLVLDSGMATLF